MEYKISPVSIADHQTWLSLWRAYCDFYEVALEDRITTRTWLRIIDPSEPVHSLIALSATGEGLGICNYVCHPNTWSDQIVCYLEDIFVAPAGRRNGIATSFIKSLQDIGNRENWRRIYWITNRDNVVAQATYDRIAKRTGHVRYEISFENRPSNIK